MKASDIRQLKRGDRLFYCAGNEYAIGTLYMAYYVECVTDLKDLEGVSDKKGVLPGKYFVRIHSNYGEAMKFAPEKNFGLIVDSVKVAVYSDEVWQAMREAERLIIAVNDYFLLGNPMPSPKKEASQQAVSTKPLVISAPPPTINLATKKSMVALLPTVPEAKKKEEPDQDDSQVKLEELPDRLTRNTRTGKFIRLNATLTNYSKDF